MKLILLAAFSLFNGQQALAAYPTRTVKVKLVIAADSGGGNQSQMTAERFAKQVEYANQVYSGHEKGNVIFQFNPALDTLSVNNVLINRDFELAPGEKADPHPKNYNHKVIRKKYVDAKNGYSLNLGPVLTVFATKGNELIYDSGKWSMKDRTYSYSSPYDQYVALVGDGSEVTLFAHEVGHYFSLDHTAAWFPETMQEASEAVQKLVNSGKVDTASMNALFDGDSDRILDTPADPGPNLFRLAYGSECGPEASVFVPFTKPGDSAKWSLKLSPDKLNIMSYFMHCSFPQLFRISDGQGVQVFKTIEFGIRQRLWSSATEETPSLPYRNAELDLVSSDSGRTDIVAQGPDGSVRQVSFAPGGVFDIDMDPAKYQLDLPDLRWNSLGGSSQFNPSITSRAPGSLHAFAIDSGTIYTRSWSKQFGWGNWLPQTSGGGYSGKPATLRYDTNSIAVIARKVTGEILFLSSQSGDVFSAPVSLGTGFTSDPVAVSWGPGRIDILARHKSGAVFHKAFFKGSWYPAGTEWEDLGGKIKGRPAITSAGPDNLTMIVRGMDDQVWYKAWDRDHWWPARDGWYAIGGKISTNPSISSYKPGRFVIAVNQNLRMAYKYWNGSAWFPSEQGWYESGGFIDPKVPVKVHSNNGAWNIFSRGLSADLWHMEQSEATVISPMKPVGRIF